VFSFTQEYATKCSSEEDTLTLEKSCSWSFSYLRFNRAIISLQQCSWRLRQRSVASLASGKLSRDRGFSHSGEWALGLWSSVGQAAAISLTGFIVYALFYWIASGSVPIVGATSGVSRRTARNQAL